MTVYEAVCSECGAVVGRSKDIPDKDKASLLVKAQALERCPHCGAENKDPTRFMFSIRPVRR